jgi:hypothetical protein
VESANGELIQLELKYCERCGGLWLRPRGSEVVVCRRCARSTAGLFPKPYPLEPAGEAVVSRAIGDQEAFWVEGGNA